MVGAVLWPLLGTFWGIGRAVWMGRHRLVHLLCETDYETTLKACDQLSRYLAEGKLRPRQYIVRTAPDPEISLFPQAILDLDPTYVILWDTGMVQVELYGSQHPSGLVAFPVASSHQDSVNPGDLQLIPRLWFYDEDYDKNPKYRNWISGLVKKRAK
jgi:hypothetical protein